MKVKYIVAVEDEHLTEQDEIRLLDLDGVSFGSEELFKRAMKDALQERWGNVHIVMGTFSCWIRHARDNLAFTTENKTIINVEIDY
jgi:hypothetical protein|nr:MAG TPA: hypothetical protein [Caudoviricetes sp.]